MLTGVGAVTAVVGWAATPLLPWLVSAPPELGDELTWAYLLAVGGNLFLPLFLPRVLLESLQKGYLVNLTMFANTVTVTATGLLLAYNGAGLPGQAAAVLAGVACQVVWQLAAAGRAVPGLAPGSFDKAVARTLLGASFQMVLAAVFGTIAARAEFLAVNQVAGSVETARYDLTRRAFVVAAALLGAVGGAAWVPLGQAFRAGERAAFDRGLDGCYRLIFGLGLSMVVPLAAYVPQFVGLWVGSNMYAGPAVTAGLAVGTLGLSVHVFQTWLLSSLRGPRDVLPSAAVYAAATAAGTFGLGAAFGPAGVAWGYAAAALACVGFNTWALRAKLGVSAAPLVRGAARPLVIAGAAAAALVWWTARHQVAGWVGLFAELAAAGAALLSAWFWLGLPGSVRADLLSRLRRR